MLRNFQKLKTLKDFNTLDSPKPISAVTPPTCPYKEQYTLRMLVRPKYGEFLIPKELVWLVKAIKDISQADYSLTGIKDSWCYVTVRHGEVKSTTDDEWHFDGASFRTSIIPERNYVWINHTPIQYKTGGVNYPSNFDPNRHDLFSHAANQLKDSPIKETTCRQWLLITPFCFHRRNPVVKEGTRTFIRISFPDIEGRDVCNTPNSVLNTPAWGRNPVKTFRDNLEVYNG